jgi:hypothetical protein
MRCNEVSFSDRTADRVTAPVEQMVYAILVLLEPIKKRAKVPFVIKLVLKRNLAARMQLSGYAACMLDEIDRVR